jgi:Na+/H+ antiporter NhaD/arsenite permease-like protein
MIFLIIIFSVGYFLIISEYILKSHKTPISLAISVICWSIISICKLPVYKINYTVFKLKQTTLENILLHHFGKASEIIIFLLSAMIIVEIIDYFSGFDVLKSLFIVKNKLKLLWGLSFISFFLSALIDNMTSIIVLSTFLKKIIIDRKYRMYLVSSLIIASNAGGAWSPIGDITTTMLWLSKKVTALVLIKRIFIPSLISMMAPLCILSFFNIFQGNIVVSYNNDKTIHCTSVSWVMLLVGLLSIMFIPFFKHITNLPPYLGMLLSLSFIWIITYFIIYNDNNNYDNDYPIKYILRKVDIASILFFLGILLSVGALDATGSLLLLSTYVQKYIPFEGLFIPIFGILSSIIDNVPLVAASMGMFFQSIDDRLWHFIAYATGTGGSLLIIGSAAGVAAMGVDKIDFLWYFKHISIVAFIGYFIGSLYIIWSLYI